MTLKLQKCFEARSYG